MCYPLLCRRLWSLLAWAVSLVLLDASRCQCDPQWLPGDAPAAFTGWVAGMTRWDPDGAGPLPDVLVAVGGVGGFPSAAKVATYDGVRWTNIPIQGINATAVTNWNGQLVVAAGSEILRRDNGAWVSMGTVPPFSVHAMTTFNNDLYVAGYFSLVGGVAANNIARWNGSTWSAVGAGTNGTVRALQVFQSVLWVGGSFSSAGGANASNLAIWNGSAWVGTASANGPVECFVPRFGVALAQTYLFVGGSFTAIGGVAAQHVARYSPTAGTWSALGTGLIGTTCVALNVATTGFNSYELVAAIPDNFSNRIFRWDIATSTWIGLGSPQADPRCLSLWAGQHVVGTAPAATLSKAVFRYASGAWSGLMGTGIDGFVNAVLADGADTIIGGAFLEISGVPFGGIARGSPGSWSALGNGMNGSVYALVRMPNGDVVAGGSFSSAGGLVANNIARWNGTAWGPLGSGVNGRVFALCVTPAGELIAGGDFTYAGGGLVNRIARWTGSAWANVGVGFDGPVHSLLARSNGDLVAGGSFTTTALRIARWNGLVWSTLGGGSQQFVPALAELPDGRIVASGAFGGVTGSIAAWNGTAWGPVHTSGQPTLMLPYAFRVLADGDLLACGNGSTVIEGIVRLHGGAWTSIGFPKSAVLAVDQGIDGKLRVGGTFVGDTNSDASVFALRSVPCPAVATTFAPGCPSSGGGNTLTTTSLPWANGTFRAMATGLPTTAVVIAVTGMTAVAPPLPLSVVFAQGGPGCNLHVAPDILGLLLTTNGTAVSEVSLPNTSSIVGLTFFHQLVPIETDALGNWIAVTATNALQLTAGIF